MSNSTASNLPPIATKIANVVFVLGGIFSLFIAVLYPALAVYFADGAWPGFQTFYLYVADREIGVTAGIISSILFGLGLRLKDHVKVNLSLLFITTGTSVYAVETYLEYSQRLLDQSVVEIDLHNAPEQLLSAVGKILSDQRTKQEVVSDLRENGTEAYPTFNPTALVLDEKGGLTTKTGEIFPIGSISKKLMVVSNETGTWMTYVTDRYGFHNPDRVYNVDTIDIVMTGDSFTEGYAVRSNENISAVLLTFGLNVVNLGKGGNGSLLQYATLREYAQLLKPRIVLYIYNEGDIGDLSKELSSPILSRYLNDDAFSQNLISRQDEIDEVLIKYVEGKTVEQITNQQQKEKEAEVENREKFASKPLIKILKLKNLRRTINRAPELAASEILESASLNPEFTPANETYLKSAFKRTLEKSNRLVSSWNGKLYFVYLPSNYPLYPEGPRWRDTVLSIAAELKLPIIELYEEVISPHPDVPSLYPFRKLGNHYNAEGYHLVAKAIAERLEADGVFR
jgi:hypothetical protein